MLLDDAIDAIARGTPYAAQQRRLMPLFQRCTQCFLRRSALLRHAAHEATPRSFATPTTMPTLLIAPCLADIASVLFARGCHAMR